MTNYLLIQLKMGIYKKAMMIGFIMAIINMAMFAQTEKRVVITIDDVPQTNRSRSNLLSKLDSLQIPVSIFINEAKVYTDGEIDSSKLLILDAWMSKPYVSPGNHSFSHPRYSTTGLELFSEEVLKGEVLTSRLATKYGKELEEFRFPFNDLGKDSLQHLEIKLFLEKEGYNITPFTVESSDWMFNYLYEYYLSQGDLENAQRIGDRYVNYTIRMFKFFEELIAEEYEREIPHIYLCHDNKINSDYLAEIISRLALLDYNFISLKEAVKDDVYDQIDHYYLKYGITWIYRWMEDDKLRKEYMKKEPGIVDVYEEYENVRLK
ncbi:polysaccharide deacetylase family protein [Mangrovivirga sp. M17]|uniref:Polysaccharide deacetylase family protein n=1 Tax=Mangrovivirga halotolerans TaxID=2993936 RepID=A0ABT3RMF6_9BACT|nr:polysaccharide deacetylase family protein [Mangrovivirga halotolerans]MCX2743000.1 polysaccharide deacetylase family protein [Mangrovivirga halotolerans]